MRPARVMALVLGMVASSAAAQGGVETCELAARDALGGAVVASARVFLLERQSHVLEHRLARDGCVGVLAFGGEGVRDVDLLVHTAAGDVVEEDVEPRAWGWARACGAAGLALAVVTHVHAGRGEVRVLVVEDAPEAAPELGAEVGACFAGSAGRGRPRIDPGEPPETRSIERALDDAAARALGWRASGAPRRGTLDPGGTELHRFALERGECVRVDALGGPGVRALALVVLGPDGAEVARDDRQRRDASVALCAPASGGLVAQLHARSGTGPYALQLRALERAPLDAARADERAAIESVELGAALRARGMRARAITWGFSDGRGEQRFDVPVGAGCVALAALRSREIAGELDLRVEGERGRWLGWDEGPSTDRGAIPVVWSCADVPRALRVAVRARDGVGRFLLVLGSASEEADR